MKDKQIQNIKTKIKAYKYAPYQNKIHVILKVIRWEPNRTHAKCIALESNWAGAKVGIESSWWMEDSNITEIEYEE